MDHKNQTANVYQFSNNSRIKRMLWIGFYTLIFNILTLTLFRFWGRTHFRRQLWSDTSVDGQPLEYTGTGKELFIGFLIAIFTVMLPLVIAVAAAQFFLGEIGALLAVFVIYIILFWLIGVAIFLARRYVISRTRYRGIRLEQKGSAVEYGTYAFGLGFLSVITLGWYSPAARIKLSEYMWSKAYFGSKNISFAKNEDALAEPVYPSFALQWFGGIGLYFLFIYAAFSMNLLEGLATGEVGDLLIFYALAIPFGILYSLVAAWHYVAVTRRIIKSLSLSGARATCDLTTMAMIKVWLGGAVLTIVTLGIGTMAARMLSWRVIASHTRFEGHIDFDEVEQASSTGPSQGEGIADGFDIGAGF